MIQIKTNERYLKDLLVRMAHHSTAIEGNTLTQEEVISILIYNYIPEEMNKREYYEVKNFKKAFEYIDESLQNNKNISIEFIKKLHSIIMDNILDNAGEFKKTENIIVGANFVPTKPYLVQIELKEMLDNLEFRLINSKCIEEKIEAIISEHIKFEKIHPFSDGNGRIGRLLMMYSCLREEIAPFVITKEEKNKYINLLAQEDISQFKKWILELVKFELLNNLAKIHTTELGIVRIKRNLSLDIDDVVEWCKNKISSKNTSITRKGKNWYITVEGCIITVNAHSFTIITAHKEKNNKEI